MKNIAHNSFAASVRESLSPETIYSDVKFRSQSEPELCAVASIHMLADFYEKEIPEEKIANLSELAKKQNGLTGEEIKSALQNLGFSSFVITGDLSEKVSGIPYHLRKGHPLLVMLGSESKNINHMVLVTGFDPTQEKIIFLDPLEGQTILNKNHFNSIWQKAGNFMLVALPN